MQKDKRILYIISVITFVLLLGVSFVDTENSKITCAALLIPITLATYFLIRRRRALSINKRDVLILSTLLAIMFSILTQFTGLLLEFGKNPYFVNIERVITAVIPITVIIISTEIIRYVMLMQNDRFASVMSYLSCVIAEVMTFSHISEIDSFNRFMDLVGLTLFPAISANFYYHFISKRYGMIPNIAYRLITTLYIFFIPMITSLPDSLTSCIKIVYPVIALAFTAALFEKKKKKAVKKGKKLSAFGIVLTAIITAGSTMLISCQFKFGALVIATESMTGEINKGDMIIYEQYEGQSIKEGQVIVFLQYGSQIVHRVTKVECINGQYRYYTKGDANESPDPGYRVASDIIGLTDAKIPMIGYPTLWLREIIKN